MLFQVHLFSNNLYRANALYLTLVRGGLRHQDSIAVKKFFCKIEVLFGEKGKEKKAKD